MRYSRTSKINGGQQYGTSRSVVVLRNAVKTGVVPVKLHVTKEAERLDVLAAKHLGASRYWWVISACSGVGWALQVPPGTRLLIPRNMQQVHAMVG